MKTQAGIARVALNPFPGVELTGWGYYLRRTWLEIHDSLHATALVIKNEDSTVAMISLDLMVISAAFTQSVREQIHAETKIPADHILVTCTHTHSAPASGGLLGVGEVDPVYETWAAKQAATAAILAWQQCEPARLSAYTTAVTGITFNRTREEGPVDPTLTTLRVDRANGSPLAVVVNYQGHPTVATVLRPRSVSRDLPGDVCDQLEESLPDCTAMYIQGACGDVNFLREFTSEARCLEPARTLTDAALKAMETSVPIDSEQIVALCKTIQLPTRRWTKAEIERDRIEAEQRLRDKDLTGWRDSIGRVMTTNPTDMVARHGGDEWKAVEAMCQFAIAWTDRMLVDYETRPEWLETEIQSLRIGDFGIVSNSSEFFTSLALAVREQSAATHLMIACYSNGRIGYLPDADEVKRKTYASYQSPKYCNQFPFTELSGDVMVREMVGSVNT